MTYRFCSPPGLLGLVFIGCKGNLNYDGVMGGFGICFLNFFVFFVFWILIFNFNLWMGYRPAHAPSMLVFGTGFSRSMNPLLQIVGVGFIFLNPVLCIMCIASCMWSSRVIIYSRFFVLCWPIWQAVGFGDLGVNSFLPLHRYRDSG